MARRGAATISLRRRRPRSARLRMTLWYAGAYFLLGSGVIVLELLFTSSSATVSIAVAPHVRVAVHGAGSGPLTVLTSPGLGRLLSPGGFATAQQHADIARLLVASWLAFGVTAVIAGGFGWIASGRVLRPLREMAATAHTITAGSLGRRMARAGRDDEFRQLGDAFDDLLGRLQASFDTQRRFVANASHELRTPLTLHRTLLQVALADPDASAASLRATCEELLASGQEHEQLLEALLTLATSERGLDRAAPMDLALLARRAIEAAAAVAVEHSVQLSSELEPAFTLGDAALVERLIANLLDNAIAYNRLGGTVRVVTGNPAGAPTLTVVNSGQPIGAGEVQRLFEPFQRLGGRGAGDGHHGLGLSIVRAVAAAHDATLEALPGPDGGLWITVAFKPLATGAQGERP
ncbi:MAG: sensor histidine kinase [Solirubrobacteraceae bacterium]